MEHNRLEPSFDPASKKACPLQGKTKLPSLLVPTNAHRSPRKLFAVSAAYPLVGALAGVLWIVLALISPQTSPYFQYTSPDGSLVWTMAPHSIVNSLLPVAVCVLVGLVAPPFAPLYADHAVRQRFVTAIAFAFPTAIAFFVDQLRFAQLILQYGPSLAWPPDLLAYLPSLIEGAQWVLMPANWPLLLVEYLAFIPLLVPAAFTASLCGDLLFGLLTTKWQIRSPGKGKSLFFVKGPWGFFVGRSEGYMDLRGRRKAKTETDY